MKRTAVVLALAAAVLGLLLSPGKSQSRNEVLQKAGLSAEARAAILTVGDDVRKLDKSHEAYVKAVAEIDGLLAQLLQTVREVSQLAEEADKSKSARPDKLIEAARQMSEMSQSFNIHYLDLQKQMQDENRRYTLVSNIMKTKHDTAKSAINNVR
jgi:sulfate adenylyltransferase subunit 1 (EFTu-like GTPase family)